MTRQSNGFEQFFSLLKDGEGLSILDFSGASQANINFITERGHRLSSEDALANIEQCFGDGDFVENQALEAQAKLFLDHSLQFPDGQFDGALVWDTLQFLAPGLLDTTVEQLLRVMRPGGMILAFFSADEKATHMPLYNYRIQDKKTLLLAPRGASRPVQYHNNRALERLFNRAQSLKFFLTRDHLREVLIRR